MGLLNANLSKVERHYWRAAQSTYTWEIHGCSAAAALQLSAQFPLIENHILDFFFLGLCLTAETCICTWPVSSTPCSQCILFEMSLSYVPIAAEVIWLPDIAWNPKQPNQIVDLVEFLQSLQRKTGKKRKLSCAFDLYACVRNRRLMNMIIIPNCHSVKGLNHWWI